MSIVEEDVLERSTTSNWMALYGDVDRWRGAMIRRFAQAEVAVSETLSALHVVPGRGGVALPPVTGQRFEQLACAIAAGGPFEAEGKSARAALAAVREHLYLRPLLSHGAAKVTVDRRGRWQLRLDMQHCCAGSYETRRHVIDKDEAEALLTRLGSAAQRLGDLLANMRKAVIT